ncbi:MAG: ZIP family metal transporter [Gammaproteobacteria bacterium]|nr:ZIP family metal transporter [Gammaproteobacteria bacterium]
MVGLISGAAGVMLAAAFFSLLQPAFEHARASSELEAAGVLSVVAGVFAGAAALYLIHRRAPHEHFERGREGPRNPRFSRLWLFVIAITLHNFPEGMAVGVGFAGGDVSNGIALGAGIGLQNVPEGLAVGVSLLAIGYRQAVAFWVGSLTGLVEPIGGVIGAGAIALAAPAMPAILGVAAGGMLFIISDEIIPETHRGSHRDLATFALLSGVIVMMLMNYGLD